MVNFILFMISNALLDQKTFRKTLMMDLINFWLPTLFTGFRHILLCREAMRFADNPCYLIVVTEPPFLSIMMVVRANAVKARLNNRCAPHPIFVRIPPQEHGT